MSLYSYEEICEGCHYAVWHSCLDCFEKRVHFCRCLENNEHDIDGCSGLCKHKRVEDK